MATTEETDSSEDDSEDNSSDSEDGSDLDEDEPAHDYKKGGYCPIELGRRFASDRYTALRKIGWGSFSTVWLVWDRNFKKPMAMKVGKGDKDLWEAGRAEAALLKGIAKCRPSSDAVLKLHHFFMIHSPNGTHPAMIFDLKNRSLLYILQKADGGGLGTEDVKSISRQLLEGLVFLHHTCRVIHGDIKPDNVLVSMDGKDAFNWAEEAAESAVGECQGLRAAAVASVLGELRLALPNKPRPRRGLSMRVVLADFSTSRPFISPKSHITQTEPYIPPETLLGGFGGPEGDVWSLGCTIFELATGRMLFDPGKKRKREERNRRLLQGMSETVGGPGAEALLANLCCCCHLSRGTAASLASFLRPMLDISPSLRVSLTTALRDPWLAT